MWGYTPGVYTSDITVPQNLVDMWPNHSLKHMYFCRITVLHSTISFIIYTFVYCFSFCDYVLEHCFALVNFENNMQLTTFYRKRKHAREQWITTQNVSSDVWRVLLKFISNETSLFTLDGEGRGTQTKSPNVYFPLRVKCGARCASILYSTGSRSILQPVLSYSGRWAQE